MVTADRFFSAADQQRIVEAVRRAEAGTAGEIVPMVVGRSADYTRTRYVAAVATALAAAIIWLALRPAALADPIWLVILQLAAGGGALALLTFSGPALRLIVADDVLQAAAARRARLAFFEHGLDRTRDHTGILILISLLEHEVELLADAGINARVAQADWDAIVAALTERIRRGQAADGLCEAIERCGALLARHFPRRPDDQNEIPNRILSG